jgi:hypothetical protein
MHGEMAMLAEMVDLLDDVPSWTQLGLLSLLSDGPKVDDCFDSASHAKSDWLRKTPIAIGSTGLLSH